MKLAWIGGNCPVQAEGTVDGKEFYFRARGEHWSVSIGEWDIIGNPEWYYEEDYGDGPYDAGWMPEDKARGFIDKAIAKYRADTLPNQPQPLESPEAGKE